MTSAAIAASSNVAHEKGCKITISGKTGDDAKPYQIKAVKKAIGEVS